LAVALQISPGMGRFFLSGQTTCAVLLGAGLLLRAHGALRPSDAATDVKTRPAEMMAERAARPIRPRPAVSPQGARNARSVQKNSQARKGFTHRDARHRRRTCGVDLATRSSKCG